MPSNNNANKQQISSSSPPSAKRSPRSRIPPPSPSHSRTSSISSTSPQRPGSRRSTTRLRVTSIDPLQPLPSSRSRGSAEKGKRGRHSADPFAGQDDRRQDTKTKKNLKANTRDCCFCDDHCFCNDSFGCTSEEIYLCPADQLLQSVEAQNRHNNAILEVAIRGMTCTQCSKAVEKGLLRALSPLGYSANVSLATHVARISNTMIANPNEPSEHLVRDTIESLGYEVTGYRQLSTPNVAENTTQTSLSTDLEDFQEQQDAQLRALRSSFLLALFCTLPIALWGAWLAAGGPTIPYSLAMLGVKLDQWIVGILATFVQFGCGWEFYRRTWFNQSGMHVLVALGTSAAFIFAFLQIFVSKEQRAAWDTAPMLITFVRASQWLQASTVQRARRGVEKMIQLQPRTATRVMDPEGKNLLEDLFKEEVAPIERVSVGNILKVIRGASIPADGRVVFGEVSVDESMVTGESTPVLKTKGAVVLGGTTCTDGAAFFQVQGVGQSSALSQIVQIVQDARCRVGSVQSLADVVASVCMPVVCTVALITYLVCPTAVMVGTSVGTLNGVVVKRRAVLEIASKVDTVVFDKTGTLTKGSLVVTDFSRVAATDADKNEEQQSNDDYLLWLLGSLERNSEQPLAKAVVEFAEKQLADALATNPFMQPMDFRAVTGRGASGNLLGDITVAVGNRAFVAAMGCRVSPRTDQVMRRLEEEGKTSVLAMVDSKIVAVIGLADELKDDAPESIAFIRDELGMDVWMVTGDNMTTAEAIRKQANLPTNRVLAEASPAAKFQKIISLQDEGKIVAMVGDGSKNSPALAQADVGISLATCADIAAEAADILLVNGKFVRKVCTALHLTRSIFRCIKWNLFWSLVYNILLIPAAAGVLFPLVKSRLPPMIAAAAMALSSLSVVLSSLMLYGYRPPSVHPMTRTTETSVPVEDGTNNLSVPLMQSYHGISQSDSTNRPENPVNRAERGEVGDE